MGDICREVLRGQDEVFLSMSRYSIIVNADILLSVIKHQVSSKAKKPILTVSVN